MKIFDAVLIDETGCEFGATVTAETWADAYAKLADDYPESRIDDLTDTAAAAERQARIERHHLAEMDI